MWAIERIHNKARQIGQRISRLLGDDDGPTATEYGVCLALIILVCIAAVTVLGEKSSELFPDLAEVI